LSSPSVQSPWESPSFWVSSSYSSAFSLNMSRHPVNINAIQAILFIISPDCFFTSNTFIRNNSSEFNILNAFIKRVESVHHIVPK
jgi:hypothetical protein